MVTTSHSQSLATTHENKIMTKGETERKTGKQVFETIILFEGLLLDIELPKIWVLAEIILFQFFQLDNTFDIKGEVLIHL